MIGTADWQIRRAVFDWLTEQRDSVGEALTWRRLQSFELDGGRIPLVARSGIWKPAVCELPLSIRTGWNSPYRADSFDPVAGTLRYAYRGTNPDNWDNVALRRCMERHVPLVYFLAVEEGVYTAGYPAFIVGDDRGGLAFSVQVDDLGLGIASAMAGTRVDEDESGRRAYVTRSVQQRLHQAKFRWRVVRAYQQRCALCALRHEELLDAAHIIPDSDPEGDPVVSNGVALCKLHHAAFDRFFFAIRPDYVIEVKPSILTERDGPMLIVGLQQIHGQRIFLPRQSVERPDPARLERRFSEFLQAS